MAQKSISFAIVIGYDSQGKRVDNRSQYARLNVAKYAAMPIKVSTNENLATKLSEYHSATYCPSYKKAEELAEFWNDCFKANSTYAEV